MLYDENIMLINEDVIPPMVMQIRYMLVNLPRFSEDAISPIDINAVAFIMASATPMMNLQRNDLLCRYFSFTNKNV